MGLPDDEFDAPPAVGTGTTGPALLDWYRRRRRDLPWRRRSDPYAILVSELMLQQTRVETVLRYYEPFLERFPQVEDLAAAEVEEVLAEWSGLGYYQRARRLHAAAREVVEEGRWPHGATAWRELPGVGEYTAAALASIVDGEAVLVLDGNVERVLARYLARPGDLRRRAAREALRAVATPWLDERVPGDSNQALMELGATVCRPLHPLCHECPLAAGCRARLAGEPERYPTPRRRRAVEEVERRVFVATSKQGAVWMVRRASDDSLLAGFWELPTVDGVPPVAARRRLEERHGGAWQPAGEAGRVTHAITHRRFRVTVEVGSWLPAEVAETSRYGWFRPSEIDALPTSSLTRKALSVAGVLS